MPHILSWIMTGYYDLILGLIPLSLIGVTAALSAVGFSLTSAVPLAAAVPVALIGHALFVNGPVEDTQSTTDSVDSSSASFEPAD
jgi:hypothetical protein